MSWYLAKILEDDLDDPGFGAEARLAGYDRPCSRCGPHERAEEAHAGTWRARRVIGGRGRGCRAGSARGPGERVERRGRGVGEAPVAGWPGPARGDAGDGEARRRKTARGSVRRGPRRGGDGQTRRRAKRRLGARRAAGARGAPLLDARRQGVGEEEARGRKAAGARRRLAAAAGAQGAPPRGARTAGSSGSRERDGIEQERRWDRTMGDWRRWKRTKGGRDEGIGKLGLEGGAAGPRPWAGLAARVAGPSCGSWEAQLGWLLHLSFLFLNSSTRI